jgi:CHAT domain-containing protein
MAARLQAKGAHFTLRACVSGKTTQVSSREALGMIWALFQAGASSVVAASWHVDVRSAAALLADFYSELSRAQSAPLALRAAALALRQAGGSTRHPYHYAAFNAYGYWSSIGGTHVK